jgi:hypothetical protein
MFTLVDLFSHDDELKKFVDWKEANRNKYGKKEPFIRFLFDLNLKLPRRKRDEEALTKVINECKPKVDELEKLIYKKILKNNDFRKGYKRIKGLSLTRETNAKASIIREKLIKDYELVGSTSFHLNSILKSYSGQNEVKKKVTVWKFEFQDHVYHIGTEICNTLRDELVKETFVPGDHPNSSKKNFQKLFVQKGKRKDDTVQPIIWLESYPHLYYLISKLSKKVIKKKHTSPSHVDVAIEVFRHKLIDQRFTGKVKRTNDPPANKKALDRVIQNVEKVLD